MLGRKDEGDYFSRNFVTPLCLLCKTVKVWPYLFYRYAEISAKNERQRSSCNRTV